MKKRLKKRQSLFDRKLDEAYDIGKMLQEEGKTYAERRAYVHIATVLLFIMSALRQIVFILSLLLGFVCSKVFMN